MKETPSIINFQVFIQSTFTPELQALLLINDDGLQPLEFNTNIASEIETSSIGLSERDKIIALPFYSSSPIVYEDLDSIYTHLQWTTRPKNPPIIIVSVGMESFKLNQIYEVIGIEIEPDMQFPSLKCFRALASTPINLIQTITAETNEKPTMNILNEILPIFTDICEGDHVTAQYILLSLVTSVFTKQEFVGKLTLNLNSTNSELAHKIHDFLFTLWPFTLSIDLENKELAQSLYYPVSNPDLESLNYGVLQLPSGSVVCLNENELKSGKVFEREIKNLNCIKCLLDSNELTIEYPFNSHHVKLEIQFIVFSQGKSFIQGCLPLVYSPNKDFQSSKSILTNDMIIAFRYSLDSARALYK